MSKAPKTNNVFIGATNTYNDKGERGNGNRVWNTVAPEAAGKWVGRQQDDHILGCPKQEIFQTERRC